MEQIFHLAVLFFAKAFDNALGTARTILIQRNKSILAGVAMALSNYIYLSIVKDVAADTGNLSLIVLSVASGIGCYVTIAINNKMSKEKTYINVIMSDDIDAMKDLRDFLARHKITNVASDSYTLDWGRKTITITAYADTKEESRKIDDYIKESNLKFKRFIQK